MRRTIWFALCALATGCATPLGMATVTLSTDHPLEDQSVVAPDLASKHYQKLIVVPPAAHQESKGTEVESLAQLAVQFGRRDGKQAPVPPPEWPSPAVASADLERALLKKGVSLISADVAGKAAASAEHASRAERLLVLGKAAGADAILEIVNFEWRHDVQARWFLYDGDRNDFVEVDQLKYSASDGFRWRFTGTQLEIAARLLDAQTGAVEAEFKVACNQLWNLPAPYHEDLILYAHHTLKGKQAYGLDAETDYGRQTCLARATQRIAEALTAGAAKP